MARVGLFVVLIGFSSWGFACDGAKDRKAVEPHKVSTARQSESFVVSSARAAIRFDLARLDKEARIQSPTAKAKPLGKSY